MRTIEKIDDVMSGVSSVAVMGHVRPDGDCVGSCIGLWEYMHAAYPKVHTDVFLDPFSESLAFLAADRPVNPQYCGETAYDIVFVLDCADRNRIGAGKQYLGGAGQVICIDHHISNPGYGDINVIYPEYSSASEVLYTLLEKEKIDKRTAECLYTGMVHDTGVFQYSNVSSLTMQRAGELMQFGFDFSSIISESFYEKKLSHQKLTGIALKRAELTSDGNGVWSYVTIKDMEDVGSCSMETDGISEALRNTAGIDYSVFFYETDPGTFKVSMRSKKKTDVSRAASAFGGGGHIRAAGCSFDEKSPQEMIALIVQRITEQNYD